LAAAAAHVQLRGGLEHGMAADEIIAACTRLATSHTPAGIVCGTGFEDRPDVLARLAAHWPLVGNSAGQVARIKDPVAFAELCRRCEVPHPAVSLARPDDTGDWLSKRIGGAGGTHIPAANGHDAAVGRYFQRRVNGEPISALLLADGRRALVLGFSSQWSSPGKNSPFRYGGAVRPAVIAPAIEAAMTAAVQRLAAALALVGLNSVDFLVAEDDFHVLEINPRPSASVEIFEPTEGSLFAFHVAACRGQLPAAVPTESPAKAAAIVYATDRIAAIPAIDWPDWTADRPASGSPVEADAPLCTVIAAAPTAPEARRLVDARATRILADVHSRPS
jgi:predicted ATP-grasp superfamily ATP-dependent carboligase